jgi:BioD-like phosphotransacetylase family protein
MVAIYICSTETRAGKTMLAIGLARRIARSGAKVGYFKPVGILDFDRSGNRKDEDAVFAKQALSLDSPIEVLSPVTVASGKLRSETVQPELAQRIKDSFAILARENDVVLAEGPRSIEESLRSGVPAKMVAEMLEAKVLLVARYRGEATVRQVLDAVTAMGQRPAGVIVNGVPREQLGYARDILVPELEREQLRVLGILPLERELLGGTVGELADYLKGSVLCCSDRLDAAIESVMIGARSFDSGLPYFNRRENKVLVTGSVKPDIQLAALETSTRCIVSTGEDAPSAFVIQRAKEVSVPVVKVGQGTMETVERIEEFLASVRFRQAAKTKTVDQLIAANVDADKLTLAMELAKG